MPNDAKLGLVVGVGLVIAVGVIFYRKDAPATGTAAIDKAPSIQSAGQAAPKGETPAKSTSVRRHIFQAGDSLSALAKQYLGDESKIAAIRDLNPALASQGEPAIGTVLLIPDADAAKP